MSHAVAVICTLAAGILVGIQPAANAALYDHVGDLGAAFVSLALSATIGLALVVGGTVLVTST